MANQQMTGSEILLKCLVDQDVTEIFGYPGGAIMPVYDALAGSRLKHILVRHEQGAAFAADAYARENEALLAMLLRHLDDEEDLIIPLILDRSEEGLGVSL